MAQTAEIVSEIEALAVHCRMPLMDIGQRAAWMRDWCEDLGKFEIQHVRLAFREWRQSGQTKFPTPGQILPSVRRLADGDKPKAAREDAWRELSDAEYQALDLPGKERHHMILSNQAAVKAGPMWRDGKPAPIEAMPPVWHEWRRRSEHHREEARRLRDLYRRAERHA